MPLENFKSEKINLHQIHGSGYGNPTASLDVVGYECPCEGTIDMSTGELTENQGTPIFSFDEGSYY